MGKSLPVMTATTPGSASAFDTSTLLMRACGSVERRSLQKSIRGSATSSANFVCPVHLARASTLRNGLPMTFKGPPLPFLFVPINRLFNRLGLFSAHPCGGQRDGLVDFQIPGAAAEVAREGFFNLLAGRVGFGLEQFFSDEEEAGRAVAALGRAQVREGLLQRVKSRAVGHAFDGLDLAPRGVQAEHQAGED